MGDDKSCLAVGAAEGLQFDFRHKEAEFPRKQQRNVAAELNVMAHLKLVARFSD